MREYAHVKLDYDDKNFLALCEGKRGIITTTIDDVTNTIGALTYRDIITDEKIKPQYSDKETRLTRLSYSNFPTIIDGYKASDLFNSIIENSLEEYINHIEDLKKISKLKQKVKKMKRDK